MIQDKFLDSYIEDIYLLNEESNNTFWFRGNKGDNSFVNTTRKVEYVGYNRNEILKRLKSIKPTDNIFIHWYDLFIGELVLNLPNKIFVYHWGGDFFCDPEAYHQKWILDKKSYSYWQKKNGYTLKPLSISFKKNIKQFYKYFSNIKSLNREYRKKNIQVGRIDYIICAKNNKRDLELTKKLYPKFRAIHLAGFYDLNFDISKNIKLNKRVNSKNSINILVGNSSSISNNHLDAFEKLKKLKDANIYCILSYGDNDYANEIENKGKEIFGSRFFPIKNFMQREDYMIFLNKMDIIFFYHNRSQAFGNLISALALGKPVFLKSKNSLKSYFDLTGITIYEADLIEEVNIKEIIKIEYLKRNQNILTLEEQVSINVRLKNLLRVLNYN